MNVTALMKTAATQTNPLLQQQKTTLAVWLQLALPWCCGPVQLCGESGIAYQLCHQTCRQT